MKISWSDKLSVNYPTIDTQHKELINRVNMLLEAMARGQGKSKVPEVLDFIKDYVVVHFGTEEELMKAYKYPDAPAHMDEHKKLVDEFMQHREKALSGDLNAADVIKTYNWLAGWLQNHIVGTDMKLGPFLKERAK